MLRMLRHGIDRFSSPSFPVHSLYISDTQGRTRLEVVGELVSGNVGVSGCQSGFIENNANEALNRLDKDSAFGSLLEDNSVTIGAGAHVLGAIE